MEDPVNQTAFYVIFIPVFTVLAFLIGCTIAFIAMSAKQDPATGDEPATPSSHG